jgi:hypothetical protein
MLLGLWGWLPHATRLLWGQAGLGHAFPSRHSPRPSPTQVTCKQGMTGWLLFVVVVCCLRCIGGSAGTYDLLGALCCSCPGLGKEVLLVSLRALSISPPNWAL